ncbi:MAG: NAD(P) transhydrogenase subunit alpha [Thermoleophilia bacterium]
MTVGVPAESLAGERRVAITPAALPALTKLGLRVVVEAGAGAAAGFPDDEYVARGAEVSTRAAALGADILATVRVAGADAESPDLASISRGQTVIGTVAPFAQPEVVAAVAATGATLYALELVPRTTRAQAMDVLSSQANIAGYKAVLLAAEALPKVFPLLTTAAGTLAPAKVFVIGAGVAGLSAIATARRLGAVVEAYDVRAAAGEEVKSLGARFLELPLDTGQEGAGSGAYASALSEETLRKQQEMMAKTIAGSDVVITTAQVQGAKAPTLLTAEQVAGMRAGSVVVDLAAEQGGNCELTKAGETVVTDNGVSIIGPVNVPSSVAHHSSLVYAKNVANFIGLLIANGAIAPDPEDDVVNQSMVCRDGEILNERVRDAIGVAS